MQTHPYPLGQSTAGQSRVRKITHHQIAEKWMIAMQWITRGVQLNTTNQAFFYKFKTLNIGAFLKVSNSRKKKPKLCTQNKREHLKKRKFLTPTLSEKTTSMEKASCHFLHRTIEYTLVTIFWRTIYQSVCECKLCVFDLKILYLEIYPNNFTYGRLYKHINSIYSRLPEIVKTGINLNV